MKVEVGRVWRKKKFSTRGFVDLKDFEETHEEKILLNYVIYNVLSPLSLCVYINV